MEVKAGAAANDEGEGVTARVARERWGYGLGPAVCLGKADEKRPRPAERGP
jgi:hypothetical protein